MWVFKQQAHRLRLMSQEQDDSRHFQHSVSIFLQLMDKSTRPLHLQAQQLVSPLRLSLQVLFKHPQSQLVVEHG